jgi:hypothetical protein
MGIRKADFAGTWYPGGRRECEEAITRFMDRSGAPEGGYLGAGGVVPHAGWRFSGLTAFTVFRAIRTKRTPELFFILGRHLHERGPESVFLDDGFETPLGEIGVHIPASERLCRVLGFGREDARSRPRDNTVELQLPFIRFLFPDAKVAAVAVAPSARAPDVGKRCAEVAEELGISACFIGSTDLTHYGPDYGFTPRGTGIGSLGWVKENDRTFVEALLEGDPARVLREAARANNACCPGGAAAAVAAAGHSGGKRGYLAGYATSYDVHPGDSFVGYAGVVY